MKNSNLNTPMASNDLNFCVGMLTELLDELKAFPPFINSHPLFLQTKHCIYKVQGDLSYDARMSLYQVQNLLSELAYKASKMKSNIAYMRSLLKCINYMSEAGRPLGNTLAPKTAMPFKVAEHGRRVK